MEGMRISLKWAVKERIVEKGVMGEAWDMMREIEKWSAL